MGIAEIELIIKEYYQIKKKIDELEKQRQVLKECIVNFLDENKIQSLLIRPYKIWVIETPRYNFKKDIILDTIGQHAFLEIIQIKASAFRNLLKDKNRDEKTVGTLMDAMEVVSLSKSLFVNESKS